MNKTRESGRHSRPYRRFSLFDIVEGRGCGTFDVMKIYTKSGDEGETGLYGGPRVSKNHPRIEAYGTVDELNSVLGMARAAKLPADVDGMVARIQDELFSVGAELATPKPENAGLWMVGGPQIEAIENAIDHFEATLEPLRQFILPGGTPGAAALHLARTICRRAERGVVALAGIDGQTVSRDIMVYLNRVGDLLFVLARAANKQADTADIPWQKPE